MISRLALQAVDRLFQDIMGSDRPFGGKIVVFGGDFRQLLPVVRKGNAADAIAVTLNSARFWQDVQILRLTRNMRIAAARPASFRGDFASFLMDVGHGSGDVKLQSFMRMDSANIPALLRHVYPLLARDPTIAHFKTRAIIAPLHVDVNAINECAIAAYPGQARVMKSYDTVYGEQERDPSSPFSFSDAEPVHLNALDPSGFPKHKLVIKMGMPMVITRNISPAHGLCNGTRVSVVGISPRAIDVIKMEDVELDSHDATPRVRSFGSPPPVYTISRIKFISTEGEYAFQMQRIQFPLAPAFATTIHKSQGATYDHVVVYFGSGCVFTHGQLYVALSRVTNPDNLRVALPHDASSDVLTNIVHQDVLRNT
jgi:hypothetical protein